MAPQADLHEEQILQAVVLSDCGEDCDQPIAQGIPKVLVPLVNTPLLDYTLDWLERSGVDEAIVYCRAQPYADKIRQHCQSFTVRHGVRGLKVSVVASEDCHSVGDAMRDLYAKSLLKDDFFLVHGDVVATLDLRALMLKHKECRTADKSVIMTCVYLNGDNKSEEKETTATLITNATTGKLLYHKRPSTNSAKLSIPTELFQSNGDLQVLPAAHDPSIAVCSEVVPSLFSDNFDYGNQDSLIRGVIEQEELLGYTIHCEILDSGYASRVTSFTAYERVSGEVIRRMAYPMVSEESLTSHRIRYTYDAFTNNYWEPSAKFHKGSGATNVVVGAGSEVSMTAKLQLSVVGDHCTVEDNVKAHSAFITNNVLIKAGCSLDHCFLGDNVTLEENVILSPGCILGKGVILGPNITVPRATCLVTTPPIDEFEQQSIRQEPDPLVCGTKGNAYIVVQEEDELDFVEQGSDIDLVEEEEEEEDSEDEMLDSAHMSDEDEHRENEFRRELTESLTNALRESSAAENVVLEINASRHAYNMSMEDVLITVTQGIVRAGEDKISKDQSIENLWHGVKLSITTFTDVLRNYVRKDRDQILVLNAIEMLLNESMEYLPLAQKILFELNQTHEILDDDVVIHWFKRGGAATPCFPALKKAITRFLEWLEQEDSDEGEEDSGDSN